MAPFVGEVSTGGALRLAKQLVITAGNQRNQRCIVPVEAAARRSVSLSLYNLQMMGFKCCLTIAVGWFKKLGCCF